jgi:hypothetical protein
MCAQVLDILDGAADAYSRAAAAFAACYGRADARASTMRAVCKRCRRAAAEKRTTAATAASSRASSAGKIVTVHYKLSLNVISDMLCKAVLRSTGDTVNTCTCNS